MEALKRDRAVRENTWREHVSTYEQKVGVLDKELENINREFEGLKQKKLKLAETHGHKNANENDLIEINAGGRVITANRGALIYQKGTMLEALFSGRWDKEIQRDGLDRIFLDVNPECLQSIINYLYVLKHSSEKNLSQYLSVGNEFKQIFKHLLLYFEIDHSATQDGRQLCQIDQDGTIVNDPQTVLQAQGVHTGKAAWKTLTFNELPDIAKDVKNSLHQEQKSMEAAKEELQRIKKNLDKEHDFIKHVSAQSLNDIVNFDVRGTSMAIKRSTLRIFKGSQLDRQFDDATWPNQNTNVTSVKQWSYEQVVDWVKHQAEIPDEVVGLFEENKVTGLELLAFGREDLKEIGISRPGTLALVIKAIKGLQTKSQCHPIFIDHDPYCFGQILDQLRLKVMSKDGYEPLLLSDIKEGKQDTFANTVDYYFPGELSELILNKGPLLKSSIISQDQVGHIQRWLDEDSCGFVTKLLYRASCDGWGASNFHSKCDNQGPTLTVIRSTGGYIFGGFCDTAWSSNRGYKTSAKAFLFTLKCHSGLAPTKMRLNQRNNGYAVYHSGSYGPAFGGGYDIHVCDNANSNLSSYTNVGNTYECPAGQTGSTFLTGSQNFQASEVEVFSVQEK